MVSLFSISWYFFPKLFSVRDEIDQKKMVEMIPRLESLEIDNLGNIDWNTGPTAERFGQFVISLEVDLLSFTYFHLFFLSALSCHISYKWDHEALWHVSRYEVKCGRRWWTRGPPPSHSLFFHFQIFSRGKNGRNTQYTLRISMIFKVWVIAHTRSTLEVRVE